MATNYALPRKPYPDPNDPTADPAPAGTYALQRQAPLTQGAQLAQDQNTQGLQTGQFADVQSAKSATDRANALRTANALQDTRGTFARSGADFSPEAASRAQDQAFSAAEAQNLNGTNATNQLQRQYRTDAQNNANTYENQAQSVAKGQQDYLTGQYNTDQANTESARRYDLSRGDQTSQFDKTFGANREDAATQRNQFGETLAQRQQEFGVTSGQSQEQINNQAGQFLQSLGQRDKEFGVTSGQNQQQINNQVDQFGRSLNQNQSQFDTTTGLEQQKVNNQVDQFGRSLNQNQSQFDVTSGQEQQKIGNQASQFNVTAGQNQQTIDNQAAQAAQRLGYDYASLSQADKQYFQSLAEKQSEFGVTSGQSQQTIDNQASQFGTTAGLEQQRVNNQASQYDLSRQDQQSQFNTTSGQTQQEIDARNSQTTYQNTQDRINAIQDPKAKAAAQAAFARGEDVSQFIAGEYNPDGSLNSSYASANPAQQSLQAKIDQLKVTNPKIISESGLDNETDAEYEARIKNMATQALTSENNVSQGVTQDAALDRSVSQKLSSGGQLSPDEKAYAVQKGLVNAYTAKSLPTNENANALKGQQVNVDGQVYTVVGGSRAITGKSDYGSDTHTDYTILDKGGQKVYVVNGKIQTNEPKDI